MAEEAKTEERKQQIPGVPVPPALDMSWAKVPTERPPKPKIGEDGFTLKMADYGMYGYAPDHWPYENDTPRGAHPGTEMGLPAPYTIYDKDEVWAENAADLMACPDVDGALVGGASLEAGSFAGIVRYRDRV